MCEPFHRWEPTVEVKASEEVRAILRNVIEEVTSRAEGSPNAIIYGTFHLYERMTHNVMEPYFSLREGVNRTV
jgi:hypothetical protein